MTDPTLTASDVRALRGLHQRGGGPLSPGRSARLIGLGLAEPHPSAPDRRYRLTGKARVLLHTRGKLPGATGT